MTDDLLEKFKSVHGQPPAGPEEFLEMFEKAILALNEKYIQGTYDFVYQNHKELYQEILEIEERLNEAWGKDIQKFRVILKKYYKDTLNCIQIYKKSLR